MRVAAAHTTVDLVLAILVTFEPVEKQSTAFRRVNSGNTGHGMKCLLVEEFS